MTKRSPDTLAKKFPRVSLAPVLIAALALSACQTPTVTKVQTVEVKVPIPTQPIRADQIPPVPPALGKRPPTLSQAADVALAGHCRDIAFILRVLPLLYVSAGVPVPELPVYPECQKH